MVARAFVLIFALVIGAAGNPDSAFAQSKPSPSEFQSNGYGATASKGSRVPYLFGRSRADAEAQTRAAGFTPRFAGPTDPGATVVVQSVEAGREMPPGATIVLRMGLVEGGSVTTPPLLGLNHDAASARAEAVGLKPMFYGPPGIGVVVASQSPRAGQQVARGTYLQLQMRAGVGVVRPRVPDFMNITIYAARAAAQQNRLRPVFAGNQDPGAVIVGQNPAAGVEVEPYAEVQLQVGLGQTRVPSFIGRSRAIAQAVASKAGLTLTITGDEGDLARVVQQTPRPRSGLPAGGQVSVVMAEPTGPGGVVPPDGQGLNGVVPPHVDGQDLNPTVPVVLHAGRYEALSKLEAAGFKVRIMGDRSDDAQVSAQDPVGGGPAPRGSVVAITLAKPPVGIGKWIAILAGLAVIGAGAVFVALRWPRPVPIDGPVVRPVNTSIDHPSIPLVTYGAKVDVGRPTMRLSHEPKAAARALVLPRDDGVTP